jgi:hypothetical protein
MHDVECLDNLRQVRGIASFQVASCGFVAGAPPGRDGISYLTEALNAIRSVPNFARLKGILIVADNDANPTDAFLNVQNLINASKDISPGIRFVAPTTELVSAAGNPAITVLMLPWTRTPGALDTLCLAAASSKEPQIARCVNAFEACLNPTGWDPQKIAKMKLRTHISAAYPTDPYIAPAWVWRDQTDLVPLNDPCFDQIDAFLRSYLI